MIRKSWVDDDTELMAAEADSIARLLQLHNKPGLIGHADLGKCTKSGTTMVCHAFAAGDKIITGLAVCESYQIASIDFATAGTGGGPLPAGTYDIYLDVIEIGSTAKRYAAYPRAFMQLQGGLVPVDESIYLVVRRGVVWSGTDITDAGADARAGKFGLFDLIALGRGNDDEVLIGDDKDIHFAGPVYFDGIVFSTAQGGINVEQYLSLGSLAGGGFFNILDDSTMWTGDGFDWVLQGHGVIDATAYSLYMHLGDGSRLICYNGSAMYWRAYSAPVAFVGFDSDGAIYYSNTPIRYQTGETSAKPKKNQFLLGLVAKARARIAADGTLGSHINVNAVDHSATGTYHVTFKRALVDANTCCPIPIPVDMTTPLSAQIIAFDVDGGGCTVRIFQISNQAAYDAAFVLVVFGGDQAADS